MNHEELTGAAELHAGKRRGLVIVLGNVALLVVMLGVPWLRGYVRTRALWTAFARYGACLYGGEPRTEPGLGMPRGHEAVFATRALREPMFAASCDEQLAAVLPKEAIFILPALKTAESDVRGAVKLVRDELAPLAARTPGARLSNRPLRALERLRAGLANHALATGIVAVPDREAFALPKVGVLPTPTRLPLYAGVNASVSIWGSDVELHALATDATGVSHVHLRAGKFEQTRAPRPKLLAGAIPRELPTTFVWAMSKARCAERVSGCADKALGIATVHLPAATLPTPRWLGAHPSGRVDRSVYRAGARVVVAALASDGATELREFELSEEAESTASNDMPPLASVRTWTARPTGSVLLQATGADLTVLTASESEALNELSLVKPDLIERIAELPKKGASWVTSCAEGEGLRFLFGNEQSLMLGMRTAGGVVTRWDALPLVARDPVDALDAARDRAIPLCGVESGAAALVLDRSDRLLLVRCPEGKTSCEIDPLAVAVRSFSAGTDGRHLTVAYSGEGEAVQVRVRSGPLSDVHQSEELVPAVCWSDNRGLCGMPLVVRVGGRTLLGTREATDMMVLESADEGATWEPLKGLGRRD